MRIRRNEESITPTIVYAGESAFTEPEVDSAADDLESPALNNPACGVDCSRDTALAPDTPRPTQSRRSIAFTYIVFWGCCFAGAEIAAYGSDTSHAPILLGIAYWLMILFAVSTAALPIAFIVALVEVLRATKSGDDTLRRQSWLAIILCAACPSVFFLLSSLFAH